MGKLGVKHGTNLVFSHDQIAPKKWDGIIGQIDPIVKGKSIMIFYKYRFILASDNNCFALEISINFDLNANLIIFVM